MKDHARGYVQSHRRAAVHNVYVTTQTWETYAGDTHLGSSWLLGARTLYAVSTRQLGRRELRANGLIGS